MSALKSKREKRLLRLKVPTLICVIAYLVVGLLAGASSVGRWRRPLRVFAGLMPASEDEVGGEEGNRGEGGERGWGLPVGSDHLDELDRGEDSDERGRDADQDEHRQLLRDWLQAAGERAGQETETDQGRA